MIDHTGVPVSNYERSKKYYTEALKGIGYTLIMEVPGAKVCGFGEGGKPDFWISEGPIGLPIHTAFGVTSREKVDAFYKDALAAGGTDNGKPGIRQEYHPNYYGAFVRDPDGHNIEAVCHR